MPSAESLKFQHELQQSLHDMFTKAMMFAQATECIDPKEVLSAFVGALTTEAILILAIAVNRRNDHEFAKLVAEDVGAVLKRHFPLSCGTGQHVMRSAL